MVFIGREDLRWIQGKELVTVFRPAPPFTYGRCFCSICGTSLGEILSTDDSFPIAANAFDSELGLSNQFHEHIADKPSWYEIPILADRSEDHPASL
jgi:hypothetical protein